MSTRLSSLPATAALFLIALPLSGSDHTAQSNGVLVLSPPDPVCEPVDRMPLEGRASPYDSASVALGEGTIKVCYGRPSARGRTMIGGEHVPFDRVWRTGANEPTTLHTTTAVSFGDVELAPGSYALYTIPGGDSWEVFLSRSTDHWGNQISDEVRAQEVGSVTVPREHTDEHVETLTLSFDHHSADHAEFVLEWETFRIAVPVHVR